MWMLRALPADADAPLVFRLMPGHMQTIGRAPGASFIVDAPLVSRVHCRLTVADDGRVDVTDLESTNGTWINGEKISAGSLPEGGVLRVGRVEFVLEREQTPPGQNG
jgi:pSer/pThr/pTyr-binding forkhead associated (FHA) protein